MILRLVLVFAVSLSTVNGLVGNLASVSPPISSARRDVLKVGIAVLATPLAVSAKDESSCPPAMKRVLVIGGNGRTGKRIVHLLKESESYSPVAMVRNLSQKPAFDSIGVPVVLGDLRYPIDHLLDGIDVVVFAAGGRTLNAKGYEGTVDIDLAGAIRSVSACQASDSVQRFVMLSGTNVAFDTKSKITHWHRAKAYADAFIRDSATFGRPLDWTIVCPATLNDDPLPIPEGGAASEVMAVVHPRTMVGPGAVGNSSRDLVAAAIVAVIDMPNTFGKEFVLLDAETKEGRSPLVVDGNMVPPMPLGESLLSL